MVALKWGEIKLLGPALQALSQQKPTAFLAGGPVFAHYTTGRRWEGDQQVRKSALHH